MNTHIGELYEQKKSRKLYRVVAVGLCKDRGLLVVIYTPHEGGTYFTRDVAKFLSEFERAKPLHKTPY